MRELLKRDLARAGREYRQRKAAAEKAVVRWEWASQPRYALDPFYFARNKFARGRVIAAPRRPAEGQVEYGFDAAGRLVVERQYVGIVQRHRWFYEMFHSHEPQATTVAGYDYYEPDKEVFAVWRADYVDGRIVALAHRARYGVSMDRYVYTRNRVRRIDSEHLSLERSARGARTMRTELRIDWDEDGELERITSRERGSRVRYTLYERPRRGESLAELAPRIEAKLVDLVPRAVKALRLREPAYAVVLAYDGEGNDMLPPVIGVGLESERNRWIAERGRDARWMIWNPAEYRHYARGPLDLRDAALARLTNKANQNIALNDRWAAGRRIIDRAAASLRRIDWSKLVPVTADFTVYAVDYELGHLRPALRAALGVRRYAALKRAGVAP